MREYEFENAPVPKPVKGEPEILSAEEVVKEPSKKDERKAALAALGIIAGTALGAAGLIQLFKKK